MSNYVGSFIKINSHSYRLSTICSWNIYKKNKWSITMMIFTDCNHLVECTCFISPLCFTKFRLLIRSVSYHVGFFFIATTAYICRVTFVNMKCTKIIKAQIAAFNNIYSYLFLYSSCKVHWWVVFLTKYTVSWPNHVACVLHNQLFYLKFCFNKKSICKCGRMSVLIVFISNK